MYWHESLTHLQRDSDWAQSSLFITEDVLKHFEFNANTMPDGSVQGNGVVQYNGNDNLVVKFNIDCLNVTGNTAIMSGYVTQSNFWYVDLPVYFRVIDNGEGSKSDPDEITFLYGGYGVSGCSEIMELDFYQITGGNIQVKP